MPYKDRNKYLSSQRGYYKIDPDRYKYRNFENKYGLTKESFFELLIKQDNRCALCAKPFESLRQNHVHVDHCHETGKVRGLLCGVCNIGLGMLGDNEEGLLHALAYVRGELA